MERERRPRNLNVLKAAVAAVGMLVSPIQDASAAPEIGRIEAPEKALPSKMPVFKEPTGVNEFITMDILQIADAVKKMHTNALVDDPTPTIERLHKVLARIVDIARNTKKDTLDQKAMSSAVNDIAEILGTEVAYKYRGEDRIYLLIVTSALQDFNAMRESIKCIERATKKDGTTEEKFQNLFDDIHQSESGYVYKPWLLHIAKKAATQGVSREMVMGVLETLRKTYDDSYIPDKLISYAAVDEIVRTAFGETTFSKILSEYAALSEEQRRTFFVDDYWMTLSPAEKTQALRAVFSLQGPDDMRYAAMRGRRLWRHQIPDTDWADILAKGAAQFPPEHFLSLFVAKHDTIDEKDMPLVRSVFKKVTNTETLLDFFQNATLPGDSKALMSEFQELALTQNPISLLLIQQEKPRYGKFSNVQEMMLGVPSILDDPGLEHLQKVKKEYLPDDIKKLPPVERAHWMASISRNMYFAGVTVITEDAVKYAAAELKEQRALHGEEVVFKPGTKVMIIQNDELIPENGIKGSPIKPRFAKPGLVEAITRLVGEGNVEVASPFVDKIAPVLTSTPDSLAKAKEKVLAFIRECNSHSCIVFTEAHGLPSLRYEPAAVYFHKGGLDTIDHKEVKDSNLAAIEKITADEMADAYIEGYRRHPRVSPTIIFPSCFSANIGRRIAEKVATQGVPPPTMIFMSEYAQFGYSDHSNPIGHHFGSHTLGLEDANASITTQDILNRASEQHSSHPGVLVPLVDTKTRQPVIKNGKAQFRQLGYIPPLESAA